MSGSDYSIRHYDAEDIHALAALVRAIGEKNGWVGFPGVESVRQRVWRLSEPYHDTGTVTVPRDLLTEVMDYLTGSTLNVAARPPAARLAAARVRDLLADPGPR